MEKTNTETTTITKKNHAMRNKKKNVRNLYPGDYFGEIAFLYNSKRQASVTSTNYTTLG